MVTAVVNLEGIRGNWISARSLIDTCATSNFMTQRLANSLGLPIKEEITSIGALDNLITKSRGSITAKLKSRWTNYEKTLNFEIVSQIANRVPGEPLDRNRIRIPKNLTLADAEFYRPAPVDLLLDVETALSILCIGQKKLTDIETNTELCFQKTLLGWIIGGSFPLGGGSRPMMTRKCMVLHNGDIDLSKFWDLEDGPAQLHLSQEETACEAHFRSHFNRTGDGRYILALPFNERVSQLGDSKHLALKRLQGLERRLEADTALKQQYSSVLEEYIALGHMTAISKNEELTPGYYLPHHAVMKKDSLTTKVRVVFDGSAKTTSGISLNDTLMVGRTAQSDLFTLLLRFRMHTIVITADIEKMYRQFCIRPEDRRYQRILWKNSNGETQTYELNTLTFGLSAAPFLAIRSLHQLSFDEAENYPVASRILREDLYVDDALTGAETREEATIIRDQLTGVLKRAGLHIRQWASNDPALFADLPSSSINLQLQTDESATIKTLGVHWDPRNDKIIYTVRLNLQTKGITKRHILSETARIFDPLGLLAPVIITAKILMQQLWALKLDWDESLPQAAHSEWISYYEGLSVLNNVSFNRHAVMPRAQRIELHGFSDASEKAYGACFYLRSISDDGQITTELLTAKTRVAPLKTVSIPRLELCAAVLLTSLYNTVKHALSRIDNVYFWTDSMIVLHWIKTSPKRLKTFVANRVADIQGNTDVNQWRHVRTHENPADLLSRGLKPIELLDSELWRSGPTWLHEEITWPQGIIGTIEDLPELRKELCLLTNSTCDEDNFSADLLARYSSYGKLVRIISYCYRFRGRQGKEKLLTISEMRRAHQTILRMTQADAFPTIINDIKKRKTLQAHSKLLQLRPFLDKNGLLRVGGRLKNAFMPFEQRHPIILPKNHHITTLLIRREHEMNHHVGTQGTLYALRQRYWPVDGRSQVWKVIKGCVRCCRTKPPSAEYIMGDLPSARVNESRPFTHVGIDYCGPFVIKEKKYRNQKRIKVYVAVFVCLAVKAVHLEIVSDLTTESFIATLRRFIARRGFCSHIYSDNGTNFVGANNSLRELMTLLKTEDCQRKIQEYLSNKSIEWRFSPPRSPHFGGLWEAAVKSFKRHLVKVAGVDLLFTFEEFNTLVTEIEAILNSRPLTPISNDPNDLTVLTPGHFLIGESLTSLRDHNYSPVPVNRLSVWQHLQKIKEDFWARWKREYLNELTRRSK